MRRATRAAACILLLLLLAAAGCDFAGSLDAADTVGPYPYGADALSFVGMGDWGRDGRNNQDDVAEQMGRAAEQIKARFVISTGDNFYPDGVESVSDPQFASSFESIYTAPSLHIPWYPVLGNHDYEGDVEAQIAYSSRSDRWTMPARYYTVDYRVDDTTEAVFVFIDTPPMVSYGPGDAGVRAQLGWLDSVLSTSTADWRIVVGHHPLYSVGEKHGHEDDLILLLKPLFERYGVQAYISGHAHSLQHLKGDGPVHYFISGGGSATRRIDEAPPAVFAAAAPGFMTVSITPFEMFVRFIDDRGRMLYATSVPGHAPAVVE